MTVHDADNINSQCFHLFVFLCSSCWCVTPQPPTGVQIRLTGSPDADEGHVQTFYNGQWWNICNDGSLTTKEATVICRALGRHPMGWPLHTLRYTQDYKDTSTDDALITGVRCQGTENSLTECLFNISHTTQCGFYDIVAVHCASTSLNHSESFGVKVRLVNGKTIADGRIEVYHDDQWQSVCGQSGWDRNAATVICHQIGFGSAISTGMQPIYSTVTQDVGILYSHVRCTGLEKRLDQCDISLDTSDCSHDMDVNAECFLNVYTDVSRYIPPEVEAVTDEGDITIDVYTTGKGDKKTNGGDVKSTEENSGLSIFPVGAIMPILVICLLLSVCALFLLWRAIKTRRREANRPAYSSKSAGVSVSWSRDGQQVYQHVPGGHDREEMPTGV